MTTPSFKKLFTIVIAAIAGAGLLLALQGVFAPRATSAESHLVWNYLVEANLTKEMQERFNTVNFDFPPKKADMAMLLLDAQTTAAAKQSAK